MEKKVIAVEPLIDVLTIEALSKAIETHPEVKQEMIYVEALNDNIRSTID